MNEKLESRRSLVRVVVTYLFAASYIVAAGYLIHIFTADAAGREAALAVFAGLGTFATAVVTFWFGSRQSNATPPTTGNLHNQGEP